MASDLSHFKTKNKKICSTNVLSPPAPLTKCYLGWEELAFPRQKADPSEFHEASL